MFELSKTVYYVTVFYGMLIVENQQIILSFVLL